MYIYIYITVVPLQGTWDVGRVVCPSGTNLKAARSSGYNPRVNPINTHADSLISDPGVKGALQLLSNRHM